MPPSPVCLRGEALAPFQASEWLSLAGVGQQTLALPEGRGLYSAVLVVDRALEGPALWLRLRSRFAFVNHTGQAGEPRVSRVKSHGPDSSDVLLPTSDCGDFTQSPAI